MKDLEEIKAKYPLAVEALDGYPYTYIKSEHAIKAGSSDDLIEVKAWGRLFYSPEGEKAQYQIGEMLAELLNLIAKP